MKTSAFRLSLPFFCFLHFVTKSIQAPLYEYTKDNPSVSHTATVCGGQMRSIACPNLQLLHIYNAFYGKLSGHDCQSPVTQFRDQIPTCFSKDAPTLIREACQGQQSCDLFAEDGLYDNPCPSVTKYLFVSFTCQGKSQLGERLKQYEIKKDSLDSNPPALNQPFAQERNELMSTPSAPKSAVVCPGQSGGIYCPALKLLKITSAFYGKQQGRDCTGKTSHDSTPTCFARDTVTTVKDICDGQQSCDLFSEAELYGPTQCSPNTQKYLQVNYICEGHSDLEQQLTNQKKGFGKIDQYLKGSLNQEENTQVSSFHKPPIDLVLRSTLPSLNSAEERIYDPWQDWANYNEYQQWRRTNPWAAMLEQNQRYPLPYMTMTSAGHGPMIENKRLPHQAEVRQNIINAPQGISTYFSAPQQARQCDQCTGDCRNYLCYGCGGCPEPPPEQQVYYYPYQKQDAAYHDAFTGHVMELSGLVLNPLPKVFRRPSKPSGVATKSKILDDDDSDNDDDDDDDDDDEDDFDGDNDSENDEDDVEDHTRRHQNDDKKHEKSDKKLTKTRKQTK